jgi:hypothetical protein
MRCAGARTVGDPLGAWGVESRQRARRLAEMRLCRPVMARLLGVRLSKLPRMYGVISNVVVSSRYIFSLSALSTVSK